MRITDIEAIQNYMLIDIDPSFVSQVEEWIDGVEEDMNKATNRKLIADDVESVYKYNGTGRRALVIDDFIEISKIQIRATSYYDVVEVPSTYDITPYCFFYPPNSLPIWKIESWRWFPQGLQNVWITGRAGTYASDNIPASLKFAATVIVAGIINFSFQTTGEIKSETIGRYSVTYTTDSQQKIDFDRVTQTIKSYRRMR